jgi:hypothetical protein
MERVGLAAWNTVSWLSTRLLRCVRKLSGVPGRLPGEIVPDRFLDLSWRPARTIPQAKAPAAAGTLA